MVVLQWSQVRSTTIIKKNTCIFTFQTVGILVGPSSILLTNHVVRTNPFREHGTRDTSCSVDVIHDANVGVDDYTSILVLRVRTNDPWEVKKRKCVLLNLSVELKGI